MEQEISSLSETENQVSTVIQGQFMKIRKNQEFGKPFKITEDLKYIANYVNNNAPNPVPILKSLGILFFGQTAAFNLTILTSLIISCRARTLSSLHKEGWQEAQADQDTKLSIIGANDVKNWTVYNVPESLSKFLEENQHLIATEHAFGLDHTPEEILIGPGLPPQDNLNEPHFPLVSIQYERMYVENFKEKTLYLSGVHLSLSKCVHIDIEYNNNRKHK